MTQNQEEQFRKIAFYIEQDEDGYPPDTLETLWGRQLDENLFQIDNIPFFVVGVSCEDIVTASYFDNQWYFDKVVRASGHSTVRVVVYDEKQMQPLRQSLRDYGCSSELSHLPRLVSVDIPPEIELSQVIDFLAQGEKQEIWSYEEANLCYHDEHEDV
jgi:hypothetical protein